MPGYLPFAGALNLPAYTCDNCGFWQRHFEAPPSCPMCLDARHVVPQDGWRFRTTREAQDAFPCHWQELEPGVWRFWNEPVSGIGPSAYLIRTENGNMGFEGCPVFSEAALDQIETLGGMQVLSSSHPHAYGALVQLQDRFDPELCLPAADFTWSAALQVSWPYDDVLEPLPGLELHRTAGHFDGHAVLFDRARNICFCGDALKFELDPADPRRATTISAHKAFVRGVPLTAKELERYRAVFAQFEFDQTWTPFEAAKNCGRREVLALIDAQLAGRPHAAPVPLDSLLDQGR
ncbi:MULTISPECIES: MBL fold metallo-hydrolase [Methylobacterium]|uniref:MBL fold metallo-hydrolase n=1 Tax=Methylobacterium TaxID=407 RepID=UPI0011C7D0E2|nr:MULTISPECIES: MBL fold metallo-hydrolase [Methylobacterium]TXN48242.1 hypothetical protein FV233_02040 [Methylobacterium sp. WL7]TXN55498.1 hypothetical protein FV228_26745 [Methylobacterium sp. WL18]GJE22998.1 hypothetical protein JHFBIEKO_3458 [Methylobacterium mesophilicum]